MCQLDTLPTPCRATEEVAEIFEERFLDVQGARIFLREMGQGPPLLFLHGNPDSGELWTEIATALPDFRCLIPDLPGFGRSSVPPGFNFSLEEMADLIEDLLEAMGRERTHSTFFPLGLVMHDFGGPYGLSWAVCHPDRVSRAVCMNTFFFADHRWHFWARVWRTPILGEISALCMGRWLFDREMRRGSPRLPMGYLDRTWTGVSRSMKASVLRLYRATDPECFGDWEPRLRKLTERIPVRVLWGDRDPYLPHRYAHRFGTSDVLRFPDCGHWLPVEAPRRVAASLRDFFAPELTGDDRAG